MSGVNKVILIGNVGKDPEVKTFDGGRTLVRLPLATSETYKDRQGEKHTSTEWHNLEAWGNIAEILEKYVKKGDKIFVEGKLKTDSWEDSQGQRRYSTKIQVKNMTMLGSPGQGSGSNTPGDEFLQGKTSRQEPVQATIMDQEEDDDDLPF